MSLVTVPYGHFLEDLGLARFDFTSATIKVAILTSSYTPSEVFNSLWSHIQAYEVFGTGYTAGGETLSTNYGFNYDNYPDYFAWIQAPPVTWTTPSFSDGRYVVIYQSSGTASTSHLIGYIDLGYSLNPDGSQDLVLGFSNGVLKIGK